MRTFSIGRNATNNVILDDKMVSRQHAQLIILDNGQVVIKDLGSSNGTFVNGNKISEYNLKAGDIVKCGNSFVKWTQYVNERPTPFPPNPDYNNSQVNSENYSYSDLQNYEDEDFSLGVSLKYLTTKIFNIGNLFKTEWDKTQAILFYSLTPIVLSLITLVIVFLKTADKGFISKSFSNEVLLPFIMLIFYYGISQFLTLSLLSLKGITSMKNNLLAASIFSFLMFMVTFLPALLAVPFLPFIGSGKIDPEQTFILVILMLPIAICVLITMVTFVYKYFRAINISKGISVHFTVFAFFLNLFFQIAFTYLFVVLAFKNTFDILKMF
jgi:hypothetical protein